MSAISTLRGQITSGVAGGAPITTALLIADNNLGDVKSKDTARANLGAAASGANADITSLTGLTTPLSPAQGGTGATSLAAGTIPFLGPRPQPLRERLGAVVDIREWNAVDATFSSANDTIILSWLQQAMAAGLPAYAPPGRYAVDQGVVLAMTADLEVRLPRGCVLKGTPNIARSILTLAEGDTLHTYGLTWEGGTLDHGLGQFVLAAGSNSGMTLTRLGRVVIDKIRTVGAATYAAAAASCDSGITGTNLLDVTITNGWFFGAGDAAIDLGGGGSAATSDDGGEIAVTACHFEQCQQAFAYKRGGKRAIFAANTMRDCFSGVSASPAGDGQTWLPPGAELVILGNTAKRLERHFASIAPGSYSRIIGNTVSDWGYKPDGTTVSDIPCAVRVLGASQTDISHNTFALEDWTQGDKGSSSHTAIYVAGSQYDGTTIYLPDRVDYSDNTFVNVTTAVLENGALGALGPTIGTNNRYTNVGTRLTATNATSSLDYFDIPLSRRRYYIGSTEIASIGANGVQSTRFRFSADPVGLVKTARLGTTLAFGAVPGGGRVSLSATMSGVQVGNSFVAITPGDATLRPAGIIYQAFVTGNDTVTVYAYNITAAAITIPSGTFYLYAQAMG